LQSPVFILSAPRSGSTLLSRLVHAHPGYTSVGETNLVAVLMSLRNSLHMVGRVGRNSAESVGDSEEAHNELLPQDQEQMRNVAEAFYLELIGEQDLTPCDKSLPNAAGASLLSGVWPQAKFILLHRHCADFVHSALAAQPWGLSGYGFAGYAGGSPSNMVFALVRCWLDRAAELKKAQLELGAQGLEIRYEDLVTNTIDVLNHVWLHLGVEAPDDLSDAFDHANPLVSPQDHKFTFTEGVHTDSIGRGARIPFCELLPKDTTERMNEQLEALGYVRISADWGLVGPSGDGVALLSDQEHRDSTQELSREPDQTSREPAMEQKSLQVAAPTDGESRRALGEMEKTEITVDLVLTEAGKVSSLARIAWNEGKLSQVVDESDEIAKDGVLVVALEALFAIGIGYSDYGDSVRRGDIRYYVLIEDGKLRRAQTNEMGTAIGRVVTAAGVELMAHTRFDGSILATGQSLGSMP
jgi:hypothetical protein